MTKNKTWDIYVVPHTHWDKEWYFTKQDSDVLLFDNINNLLEMLDNNEIDTFTYDGQFSIIDDYLSYSYNNFSKLQKYVKEKRLIIGPWYTQPDFFNITSESIVRNLLYGINGCKQLGADYLKVAYVPDSFGHNSQMPQIYNQFGINNFIYWRGISKQLLDNNGIISQWIGLNENSVLSYNLLFGYWPFGANYPYQDIKKNNVAHKAKEFLLKVKSLIDEIKNKTKNNSNKILLPLGGDQAPIMKFLKEFILEINKISEDKWILSDYDNFFNELNKENLKLSKINGELKSPFLSRIHKTIGSQRQDIKSLMKYLEVNLFSNLEPLMTYYFMNTKFYEKDIIDKIIKKILTSQAHDSIGGCNSDRTNEDILNRLKRCLDLVETLQTKILKNISLNLNLKDEEIIIFNSSLQKNYLTKKIKIFSKKNLIKLVDEKNNELEFFILKKIFHNDGMKVKPSINGEEILSASGFFEYEILISNLKLNSNEIKKIKILDSKKNQEKIKTKINKRFNVSFDNEKIQIEDLITDKKINIFLEAEYDFGDSYDFSPKQIEKELINKFIKFKLNKNNYTNLEIVDVTLFYKVPTSEKLNKKIIQKFIFSIFIYKNSVIDINLKTKNKSSEIRWRLISESEKTSDYLINDQCYSVITRNHNKDLENWREEGWKEAPVNVESFENFVGFPNEYFIYTNQINEYELIDNNKIALTLFRSVSTLGRNNLLNRPGRASGTSEFNIKTNDSKLYNHEFEYNLMFDFRKKINPSTESQNYIKNILYYQNQNLNNLYKRFDRFLINNQIKGVNFKNNLMISNNKFVIKTFKKAENSNDLIIRGFNPYKEEIEIDILFNQEKVFFSLTNLNEEILKENILTVKVKSNQIITILIKEENFYDR